MHCAAKRGRGTHLLERFESAVAVLLEHVEFDDVDVDGAKEQHATETQRERHIVAQDLLCTRARSQRRGRHDQLR